MSVKPSLEQLLKEKFNISEEQWQDCLRENKESPFTLPHLLAIKGLVSEEGLLGALSEHLTIPFIRIKGGTFAMCSSQSSLIKSPITMGLPSFTVTEVFASEEIDIELIKKIPVKLVTHYAFMPLKIIDGVLQIAINDPLEILTLDDIKLFLNQAVRPLLASKKDILDAIKNFYGVGAETLEAIANQTHHIPEAINAQKDKDKNIQDEEIDPSVIKFLNQVLQDAIKQRASDIHFEPLEDDLRIRYRIDGILYKIPSPPTIKNFQPSIASRIKIMASLDIAEKRKSQDGRMDIRMENEIYDARISIIPTPFGESISIRILPRSNPIIGLEGIGLTLEELGKLEKMISKPHGIILVTGPTGSGKTTTLYSCLNKINTTERKILTIEDPIEYQLKGITQMQVEPKTGFTFANALRAMLRHDPDIMMVGEIRDTETAELAVRTALTGHLVLSTLHTNDAPGAVTRLLDMGIDPFLVSSSVILIIAQRLVRLICPHCKEAFIPESALLKQLILKQPLSDKAAEKTAFRGRGCERCRFTGYQGRTGIFEMLAISDEIRELILRKAPSHQIKQKALTMGMQTLREGGWNKIHQGITTIEEVLRVTQEEEEEG